MSITSSHPSPISIDNEIELSEHAEGLTRRKAEAALQRLQAELVGVKKDGNKTKANWVLLRMAMVMRGQHKFLTAIELLEEIRQNFDDTKDDRGLGYVFQELSLCHRELQRNALAIDYGNKALKIFQKLNGLSELAWSYNNLSLIHLNLFRRHESLIFAKKARALFIAQNSLNGQSWNASIMATLYYEMGFYAKAEILAIEAHRLFSKIENKPGIAWSLLWLGMINKEKCNFDVAEKYLIQSKNAYSSLKLKDRMGWGVLNEAAIKRAQGLESEAMALNKRAIKLFGPFRNQDGVAWSLFQIGQVYRDLGQLTKAWQLIREALNLHTDISNKKGIGWAENEWGKIYLELGDPSRAKECFVKAKVIAEQLDENPLKVKVTKNLAWLFMEQGMLHQGQEMLRKNDGACEKIEARETQAEGFLEYAKFNFIVGDFDKARQAIRSAQNIIDKLGLLRLKPTLGLYLAELFMIDGNKDGGIQILNDVVKWSNAYHQRNQRALALLGLVQANFGPKKKSELMPLLHQVEKDVRVLGSRKLKAKFLAVKGILAYRADSQFDPRNFNQCIQILNSAGLVVIERQILLLMTEFYRRIGQKEEVAECRQRSKRLLENAPLDLNLVEPNHDMFGILPVSLIV